MLNRMEEKRKGLENVCWRLKIHFCSLFRGHCTCMACEISSFCLGTLWEQSRPHTAGCETNWSSHLGILWILGFKSEFFSSLCTNGDWNSENVLTFFLPNMWFRLLKDAVQIMGAMIHINLVHFSTATISQLVPLLCMFNLTWTAFFSVCLECVCSPCVNQILRQAYCLRSSRNRHFTVWGPLFSIGDFYCGTW